jgi:hypothetical protein
MADQGCDSTLKIPRISQTDQVPCASLTEHMCVVMDSEDMHKPAAASTTQGHINGAGNEFTA